MSLNHIYKKSALSADFDIRCNEFECKSIIINGGSFIPTFSNTYDSIPTALSLDLTLFNAIGFFTITPNSTGLRKFITLSARLSGVQSVARNRMEFLLNLPTGYSGSIGEVVVLNGQAVSITTGLNFQAVSSNINPSNVNQVYVLLNSPVDIDGNFTINVSITTEVFT